MMKMKKKTRVRGMMVYAERYGVMAASPTRSKDNGASTAPPDLPGSSTGKK
jgi:hypothetical protein